MSEFQAWNARKGTEIGVRGAVIIVDDKSSVRDGLAQHVISQFGDRYVVVGVESGKEALDRIANPEFATNVAVVAVDLALGIADNIEPGLALITKLRQQLPKDARILAYTLLPLGGEIEKSVRDAGASSYVRADDLGPVITRVFLEKELHELQASSPLVARVFDTMDVGISIQDRDMNVLFVNQKTRAEMDLENIVGQRCWRAYHRFLNRTCPCTECVAWSVIQEAERRIQAGDDSRVEMTDCMLLPVRGRLARVEVNAAPFLSSDRTRVLAVVEATRFVTEEWERKEAHERLHEVIEAARRLGWERPDRAELASVSVYYRPAGSKDLHLFDSVEMPSVAPSARLLRYEEMLPEYAALSEDQQPRMVDALRPTEELSRFLWCRQTDRKATIVFIDTAFSGTKPEELFKQDLLPYWQYVVEVFEEARASRENIFRAKTQAAVEEFLAQIAEGADENGDERRILQSAMECIRKTLQPASMYIRTLDRKSNSLVKRLGFGPFSEIACQERVLERGGAGGAQVAGTREGIWEVRATPEKMAVPEDRQLTAAQRDALKRISSYVTLPLVFSHRVLGTFNVQFEDDSLFSDAKREFLEAIASALGSALGRLEWTRERRRMARSFRELDGMMFRTDMSGGATEDEQEGVVKAAARMVLDLTFAELVLYYRRDEVSKTLRLVTHSRQEGMPEDAAIPSKLPENTGVVGRAVTEREVQVVDDYHVEKGNEACGKLLAAPSEDRDRKSWQWVGCEVAAPVMVGGKVRGVLVAISAIPRWLSEEDKSIISEFAFKIGLCLEAKEVARRLAQELRAMTTMNVINGEMGRTSNPNVLYRLLLLAVTVGDCLGFSRAILFLKREDDGDRLDAETSVGSISRNICEQRWEEARGLNLDKKILRCLAGPVSVRPGDLQDRFAGLTLDLATESAVQAEFAQDRLPVRRRGEPHILDNARLREILSPSGEDDVEYVLAPVKTSKGIVGVVLADRAFLAPGEISDETLDLLGLLARECGLILETLDHRRKEEESRVAEALARGVSYTLRSRAALLEADLWLLQQEVGEGHVKAISDMKKSIDFFKRAGTLASEHLKIEELGVETGDPLDLNTLVAETVNAFHDPRIRLIPSDVPLLVRAERRRLIDVFVEILLNARDITDRDTGEIIVEVRSEEAMARVDVTDNGPGISRDLRPHLFEMFKCYPAGRMGLGLSYVRTVVTRYRGSVEEIGEEGHGAHFVVRLPLVSE